MEKIYTTYETREYTVHAIYTLALTKQREIEENNKRIVYEKIKRNNILTTRRLGVQDDMIATKLQNGLLEQVY